MHRKIETTVNFADLLVPAESSPRYNLCGIIVHRGQHLGGHYIAVVRMADNHWYLCDDEVCPARVSASYAFEQEATILIYQQV